MSVLTNVRAIYDLTSNRLLPGTQVALADRATECLSELSLDFERSTPGLPDGPRLRVQGVLVDGVPASFRFARPAYPGDPHGPDDPDPRAHQASQHDPVGGPSRNPLPPACSPELHSDSAGVDSRDGAPCPADKLVIDPRAPIPRGHRFVITVRYDGTPGLHHDGDGSTEGWFRTRGSNSMTVEPVGGEDWMPLNDFPAAKPSYDFTVTTARRATVIANGERTETRPNPPSGAFPHGSATTRWHARMPIASYLALLIIGDYTLSVRTGPHGVRYYQAQDRHIARAQRARNTRVMDRQPDITTFESSYNGPYPFPSDGIVAAVPGTSDDTEEMASMIVFTASTVDTETLYHETMHQWWGDNVTEDSFRMTFFKEGMATLAETLMSARSAQTTAGGPRSTAGRRAFARSLAHQFHATYTANGTFWNVAPSNPTPAELFDTDSTYERPAAAYIALRAILGSQRFSSALRQIQHHYGGATITEHQLETSFSHWLPHATSACTARLQRFFAEWFDTPYTQNARLRKPDITGPGLAGPGFYTRQCPA